MITAQAVLERGLLDSLVSGLAAIPQAIESQLGHGTAKWVIGSGLLVLLFWALRPRR